MEAETERLLGDPALALDAVPASAVDAVMEGELGAEAAREVVAAANAAAGGADAHAAAVGRAAGLAEAWAAAREEARRTGDEGAAGNLWLFLSRRGLDWRPLVALLCAHASAPSPCALVAAATYASLLRVPGNYHAFRPLALRAAVRSLATWADAVRRAPAAAKGKAKARRGRGRSSGKAEAEEDGGGGEEEEGEDPFSQAAPSEEEEARRARLATAGAASEASELLDRLAAMLRVVSLKQDAESLEHIAATLVSVSRLVEPPLPGQVAAVDASVRALDALASSPAHGATGQAFRVALKHLVPSVLMAFSADTGDAVGGGGGKGKGSAASVLGSAVPRAMTAVRERSLALVVGVVSRAPAEFRAHLEPLVVVFAQHLCYRAPDKAQYRAWAARSVADLAAELPRCAPAVSAFLGRIGRSNRAPLRLFAVEAAATVLARPGLLDAAAGATSAAAAGAAVARPLLATLLARCSDRVASVRAKALTNWGAAVRAGQGSPVMRPQFAAVMFDRVPGSPPRVQGADDAADAEGAAPSPSHPAFRTPVRPGAAGGPALARSDSAPAAAAMEVDGGVGVEADNGRSPFRRQSGRGGSQQGGHAVAAMLGVLQRRAADSSPLVRRAAIQALEAVLLDMGDEGELTITGSLSVAELDVLFDGCMDRSTSIRRQAMSSLTALVSRYPDDAPLRKVWLGAVLPLAADHETGVQDACLRLVSERLLAPLATTSPADAGAGAWETLSDADADTAAHFQRAVSMLLARAAQQPGLVPAGLAGNLLGLLRAGELPSEAAAAAAARVVWLVVEPLAACPRAAATVDAGAVLAAWEEAAAVERPTPAQADLHCRALRTLASLFASRPGPEPSAGARLLAGLYWRVRDFALDEAVVQAGMMALRAAAVMLLESGEGGDEVQQSLRGWEAGLLAACEEALCGRVQAGAGAAASEAEAAAVSRQLFTLGEVVLRQVNAVRVPPRAVTVVQAMMAPELGGRPVPDRVRAHAWTAFGKMCMRDQALAESSITMFARELESGGSAVIRNNILVVMCDLARTFTSVVDRYVPFLTARIRDDNAMVRRHTLMVLSQLLQEDYLKWSSGASAFTSEQAAAAAAAVAPADGDDVPAAGQQSGSFSFCRFLRAVADEDRGVAAYAREALGALLRKDAGKAYGHLVEAVFYFNGCGHGSLVSAAALAGEQPFAMAGPLPQARRRRAALYSFLLDHVDAPRRLMLVEQLRKRVLVPVLEGAMPLGAPEDEALPEYQVALDTLALLAGPGMKLRDGGPGDDNDEEEGVGGGAGGAAAAPAVGSRGQQQAALRRRLVQVTALKHLVERMLPTALDLKRSLESRRSKLQGPLMRYLAELWRDHPAHVKATLGASPEGAQACQELEYDVRRFEQERKAAARAAASGAAAASSGARRRSRGPISPLARSVSAPPPPAFTEPSPSSSCRLSSSPAQQQQQQPPASSLAALASPQGSVPGSSSSSSSGTGRRIRTPRVRRTPVRSPAAAPSLRGTPATSATAPAMPASASGADVVMPSPFRAAAPPVPVWDVSAPPADQTDEQGAPNAVAPPSPRGKRKRVASPEKGGNPAAAAAADDDNNNNNDDDDDDAAATTSPSDARPLRSRRKVDVAGLR